MLMDMNFSYQSQMMIIVVFVFMQLIQSILIMTSITISILLTLINNGTEFERKEDMKSLYQSKYSFVINL